MKKKGLDKLGGIKYIIYAVVFIAGSLVSLFFGAFTPPIFLVWGCVAVVSFWLVHSWCFYRTRTTL